VVRLDIHREIRFITRLAQAGDPRIVSVGKLLLFSTAGGDAWLLDAEDQRALCLCEDGKPQSFRILDSPQTLAIEWPATFVIRGAEFIVHDNSGGVIAQGGYPTVEISAELRHVR
jgi:hypothetical protein